MRLTRAQTLAVLALALPAALYGIALAVIFTSLYVDEGRLGPAVLGTLLAAMLWSFPGFGLAALIAARPSGQLGERARNVALLLTGLGCGLLGLIGIAGLATWNEPGIGGALVMGAPISLATFYVLIKETPFARSVKEAVSTREADGLNGAFISVFVVVVLFATAKALVAVANALQLNGLAGGINLIPAVLGALFLATFPIGWIVSWNGRRRGAGARFWTGLYAAHRWLRAEDPAAVWSSDLAGFPHRGEVIGVWRCAHKRCGITQARVLDAAGQLVEVLAGPAKVLRYDNGWWSGLVFERVEDESGGSRRWRFGLHRRSCRWVPMSSERRDAELARLGASERAGLIEAFWCRDCEATRIDFALADERALVAGHVAHPQPIPVLMVGMFVIFARGLYLASDTMAPSWPPATSSTPQPKTQP